MKALGDLLAEAYPERAVTIDELNGIGATICDAMLELTRRPESADYDFPKERDWEE